MQAWHKTLYQLAFKIAMESGRSIAHLALSNGKRRSIDWIQKAVFIGMREEFETRGISQKVAADMLGVSVRTYQRYCTEGDALSSNRQTLWTHLHERLTDWTPKDTIYTWFPGRSPEEIGGIMYDMVQSGWLEKQGALYIACNVEDHWTNEMIDARLKTCELLGERMVPEELELQTGVSEARWKDGIKRRRERPERGKLTIVKDIPHAFESLKLALFKHMMRYVCAHEGMYSQFWVFPVPPSSDPEAIAWFEEQLEELKSLERKRFGALIKELHERYPERSYEDIEQWHGWMTLIGPMDV